MDPESFCCDDCQRNGTYRGLRRVSRLDTAETKNHLVVICVTLESEPVSTSESLLKTEGQEKHRCLLLIQCGGVTPRLRSQKLMIFRDLSCQEIEPRGSRALELVPRYQELGAGHEPCSLAPDSNTQPKLSNRQYSFSFSVLPAEIFRWNRTFVVLKYSADAVRLNKI